MIMSLSLFGGRGTPLVSLKQYTRLTVGMFCYLVPLIRTQTHIEVQYLNQATHTNSYKPRTFSTVEAILMSLSSQIWDNYTSLLAFFILQQFPDKRAIYT